MNADTVKGSPRVAQVGWGILIAISVLLVLYGIFWALEGPQLALENIAERTTLTNSGFQRGNPSASDVITLTSRNFAIVEAALGLMALLMAWTGFRHGSAMAWKATAVLVAGLGAMAANFIAVGGLGGGSIGYIGIALLALVGLVLARAK